jgi:outer membrane cobalamin receptor
MSFRPLSIILLCFLPVLTWAQGSRDSILKLPQVDVHADREFMKETAGMKETQVDSLVFIQKRNLTLSELLSENTPLFVKSEGRGALASASFRGTAASHTRVNWNGININSPMLGMVDFSLIPVFIIDDINLRHGNSSIADGAGGLGGSINLQNRADWNNIFNAAFIQGIGSYGSFDEYLQIGLGNKKIQWRTRLYHNQSENDFTFRNRYKGDLENGKIINPIDTNKNAGYHRYGLLQEVYFQPASKHMVSAKWWAQQADRSIPQITSSESPDNSNINKQDITDHKLVVDWNFYGNSSQILFRTGYSKQNMDYVQRNQIEGDGFTPAIYSESSQSSLLNHAAYKYSVTKDLSLESNIDINYHSVQSMDSVSNLGYIKQRLEYSALLAARYSLADIINLNLMIRQDIINSSASPLVPFAGIDFIISEQYKLILKASVARNYHTPSLNDLYWQPGGNPDLLPEDGISYEAGLKKITSLGKTELSSEISAYHSKINNWIVWLPGITVPMEPLNIKKVRSRGLEANSKLDYEINALSLQIMAAYAYTSSVNQGDPLKWGDESIGKQLVYIPLHSGNLFFHLAYKGYSVGWQHNSYSERFTTTSNNPSKRDWLYPYFMNDLTLAKEFSISRWELLAEIKIYNLFDEKYHSVLSRPMPGRNFMFMLKAGL